MIAEASFGPIFAALAAAQADSAARSLARRRNRHLAVHAARKAIRRLRSILCLCEDALGPEVAGIDRSCKRLARSLSGLRDAHVAAVTARDLASADDDDLWRTAAAWLEDRRERLLGASLAADPDFRRRRSRLDLLAKAVLALPWDRLAMHHLREGIARSRHRVARARQASELAPSHARRHRWRRRLRRLRMQLQAIQDAAGSAPTLDELAAGKGHASIRALRKQSNALGRLQDLRLLETSLKMADQSLPLALLRDRVRAERRRLSA